MIEAELLPKTFLDISYNSFINCNYKNKYNLTGNGSTITISITTY